MLLLCVCVRACVRMHGCVTVCVPLWHISVCVQVYFHIYLLMYVPYI